VEGYIHKVSEVKVPSSGSRYFDFKVQERDESRRVVCFVADKWHEVKEKENSKSAVRLTSLSPQKRKYEPDTTEYRFNNYSKVMATNNLSFPWNDISGTFSNASVKKILDDSTNGDIVSVKAKVVSKSPVDTVYSHHMRKELKKCELIIVDSTAAIPLTVWEDMIDKVENEKSYLFSGLRVSFFRKKYLNATKDSQITICEQIVLSNESSTAAQEMKPKEKQLEAINGKILAIEANKLYICINCKGRIRNDDAPDSSEFMKCSSCSLKMIKASMSSTVSANIVIMQGEENIGRFYCSHAALNAMFESISTTDGYSIVETNVTKLTCQMIEETLLLIKNITFKLCKQDKTIESMKVAEMDSNTE